MGAAQILGASLRLLRRSPWLFGGLALWGAAPLCVLVLALHHVGVLRGGARPVPGGMVLLLGLLVTAAVFARSFFHAAMLKGLSGVLSGAPADLFLYLREARRHWLPALVTGATVSMLGLASGFLYFAPVAILGGTFVLALPRVVLDDTAPWRALTRGGQGGSATKAFSVNLLYFVLAAALFANLYLLVQLVLALCRIFFDLDVSYLAAVLSLDNGVYALALACVTLLLLEPIRVLSSGLLHLESKVRREGLDLAPRVEALERPARRGPAALVLLFFLCAAATPARAAPAIDTREAASAIAADLGEKTVSLKRLRGLAGRHREAKGERGEFWRNIEREILRVDGAPADGRRELAAALGQRLAQEALSAGADPRAYLQSVLARSEFQDLDPSLWAQPPQPPPEPSWEDKLPFPLRGKGGGGISGFTLLAILLGIAAVGAAAALAYVGAKSRKKSAPAAPPLASTETAQEGLDALARDPEDWRAEADALAARGEHRSAVRRLYLAVLVALHRGRIIEYEPSRTNWDYLRRFTGPSDAKTLFRTLTQAFDFIWYGERPVEAATYAQLSRGAAELVARAEPRPEARVAQWA
jgi:hypothetical protein